MPLTAKGKEIMASMVKTYHDPKDPKNKKAKAVFYAMINAHKLMGAENKGAIAKKG